MDEEGNVVSGKQVEMIVEGDGVFIVRIRFQYLFSKIVC